MPVTVRSASASDARALAEVHHAAWVEAYRPLYPGWFVAERDTPSFFHGLWEAFLQDDQRPALAAVVGEDLLGFVRFGRPTTHVATHPDTGELLTLYVHPARQGAGVGAALLEGAERGLADLGYRDGVLGVVAGHRRALGFYERAGWTIAGRSTVDFGGFAPEFVHLTKKLGAE